MVTGAPTVVRLPHPVQAGALPAVLWIARRLLSVAMLLGILWLAPVAAEATAADVAVVLVTVAAAVIASHLLARFEQRRVPGALGLFGGGEEPRMSYVPSIAADVAELAIVITVLPHLLSRSDDHGILAGTLAALGGALAASVASRAADTVWWRLPGWRRSLMWSVARAIPLAATLTVAGVVVAPDPDRVAAVCFWFAVAVVCVGHLLFTVTSSVGRPLHEDLRDGLDGAADVWTGLTNASPSLRDRERSRARMRNLVAVAVGAAIVVFVGLCAIVSL